MNKCIICNQEIKTDSQFINGNWYHNNCIELMAKQNKAYENMRKEIITYIDVNLKIQGNRNNTLCCNANDLLNILNKVGSDK